MRKGSVLVYVTVAMIALCAVGSLAMDYARAQVVKTELRRAADAAAMAGLQEIRNGNGVTAADNAAVAIAAANTADGSGVILDPTTDIEYGVYDSDTDTFTVLYGSSRASATAIHVTCSRTAARNNAVPLTLARVIGQNSIDVSADSVAAVNSSLPFAIVGIDSFSSNSCDYDSWNSSLGAYGGANKFGNCSIASNGNLTFTSGCHIHSEAHPGIGKTIIKDGGTQINQTSPFNSGAGYPILAPETASVTSTISYTAPVAPTSYNNSGLGVKLDASNNFTVDTNWTIPAGTYVVNDFTINHDKQLTCTSGPVIVYVNGNFYCDGMINSYLTNDHNFLIYMTNAGTTFQLIKDSNLYASIYAPLTDVTFKNGHLYGQVVGKTLVMNAKDCHYDESFADGSAGGPAKKKWIKHPQKWKRK